MRHLGRAGALAALLGLTSLLSQARADEHPVLVLEALTPSLTALPREPVHLLAHVENVSGEQLSLTPSLVAPDDWRVLIPPQEFTLGPGSSQLITVSVLVSTRAEAGDYVLHLALHGSQRVSLADARFRVRISEVRKIEVAASEIPRVVVGDSYSGRFLIRNTGNTEEDVELVAPARAGFSTEVEPKSIWLKPGQSSEAEVVVTVTSGLSERQRHDLRLRAASRDNPSIQAEAGAQVEVVPSTLDESSALHLFPFHVRLAGGISTGSPGGRLSALSPLGFEVRGSGRLWEDDPGKLTVHWDEWLAPRRHRRLVRYEQSSFEVAMGNQDFIFSPIVAGGSDFGIMGRADRRIAPDLLATGRTAIFGSTGGSRFGLGTSLHWNDRVQFSAQLLTSPPVASARIQGSSDVQFPDSSDPVRVRGDLEYGISWPVRDHQGRSLHFEGSASAELGSVQVGYEWTDGVFASSVFDRSVVSAYTLLRLDEAFEALEAFPVNLELRYRSELEQGSERQGEFSESRDQVEPHRLTLEHGGTLSAYIGPVNMSLEYERSREARGTLRRTDQEQMYQVRLALPLVGGGALQQSLGWRSATNDGSKQEATREEMAYGVAIRTPLGDSGAVNAKLEADYRPATGTLGQLGFELGWAGWLAPELQLVLNADFQLSGSELARLSGSGSYSMGQGEALDFDLQANVYRDRVPGIRLEAGYSFPLRVPLGYQSRIAQVNGVIAEEDGTAVSGAVVEIAGQSVATGGDGRFRFPAVPAGEHYMRIRPETVKPGWVFAPALPQLVELAPGDQVRIELRLIEAAQLQGRLLPPHESDREARSRRALLPSQPPELEGVPVELLGDGKSYRTLTDSQGEFSFVGLLPGRWELRVERRSWPEEYQLQQDARVVKLEAGERASVDVELRFEPRVIRFIDEGVTSPVETGE